MPESPIDDVLQTTQPIEPTKTPEEIKALKKAARQKATQQRKQKKLEQQQNQQPEPNLSETMQQVLNRRTKPNRRTKKPVDQRWGHGKERYNFYLQTNVKKAADIKVSYGESPHPYLSGTINQMLQHWIDGHYDEIHTQLGWPEPYNDD